MPGFLCLRLLYWPNDKGRPRRGQGAFLIEYPTTNRQSLGLAGER